MKKESHQEAGDRAVCSIVLGRQCMLRSEGQLAADVRKCRAGNDDHLTSTGRVLDIWLDATYYYY